MNYKIKQLKPDRFGFGEGVLEAAKANSNIIGLGADITSSVSLNFFSEHFPNRFYSIGIAEQNCISIAAGLALNGKIPVFSSYGVFAALRTTDQIRVSICYNNLHVIIGGAHAGISVGPDGATHQALEDIAIMRSLPNMTVLSPCDATQAKQLTMAAFESCKGPVYIRFGRDAVPDFMTEEIPFEIGKGQTLVDGNDITLIATGHLVWEAIKATEILKNRGIHARVINIHTIKPIDKEIIIKAAKETNAIITCEEHQIDGGLGSAVAEVVVKNHPVKMDFIGMNNCFGQSGTPTELMEFYGLTAENIVNRVLKFLDKSTK